LGKKVNPLGFRLGSLYTWKSRWFADSRTYKKLMHQDVILRKFLFKQLRLAGIDKIEIERSINKIAIIIHVARPGVVIGRGGSGLEKLKKDISQKLKEGVDNKEMLKIDLQIKEVKSPDASAQISLMKMQDMLVKRYPHRRAVANIMGKAMQAGAKGIKIVLAGRIAGAEISRTEKYNEGRMPTQTLRSDIDYAESPALTKSGYIGIKIWIYKGEKEIE